jgi:hypothetical protein
LRRVTRAVRHGREEPGMSVKSKMVTAAAALTILPTPR